MADRCELKPFIDGASVTPKTERRVDAMDPSTGRACTSIPAGSDADADAAVAAARRAFDSGAWSDAAPSFRSRKLHQFADLIEAQSKELDALDAGEMGKPIAERFGDAATAARLVRFCAEGADKITGEVYGSDRTTLVSQRRVPRGVVAAVTPWNFPTLNAVIKVAPALAGGNCVVLKPSELSSRSAIRLAELAVEADLPPGAFNVIPGLGETVGRALGLHPDVDMLAFTGSTHVGKLMLQYSGMSNMKVVLAECGGKSPHIVLSDDVDLQIVSAAIARGLLTNQGQICSVGSRLLVHRSVENRLVEMISGKLKKVVIGRALDPATTFGPLASDSQCSRVMAYIDGAPAEGAELAFGGKRVLRESGGYFVEPTLFCNVSPQSRLAQEEIFGPVLSVIPFSDENEAIRVANATGYGMASYLWTSSISAGMRFTKKLRSSVWINAAAPIGEGPGPAVSFEPAKQSGFGIEGGLAGIESYLRRQLVWINHA